MSDNIRRRIMKLASLVMVLALAVSMLAACSGGGSEEGEEEPEEEKVVIMNPFTGDLNYTEEAFNRRPVAIVVENHPDARPQWGIDDENYSPDIIVQGEVEGGITRTLWMYADYTKLPEIIGPIRSARPPFIRFADMFDSIFIHWGYSHTSGDYTGADKWFEYLNLDHIDRMWYDNNVELYDRHDRPYVVNVEHTGIIYGALVPDAIKDLKFRTERKMKSPLSFNETKTALSDDTCKEVYIEYSESSGDYMSMTWTYNEEDQKYHTDHFDTDVARDNLIVLECETEYITNTKTTYCNYKYKQGGTGKLFSNGTVKDFKWSTDMDEYTITFYTEEPNPDYAAPEDGAEDKAEEAEAAAGEEAEPVPEYIQVPLNLNPGKSWIGLISSNNGGKINITPMPSADDEASDESSDEEA